MLEALRAASQSWAGRAIMGVVVLAFVFWGIYWVFADPSSFFGGNDVARVGSKTISVETYRSAYQRELQQLQARARRAITNTEAQQMGLDREVLVHLLSNALLDQAVSRYGLAISDKDLAEGIVQDPAFKGPDGKFDRQAFEGRLQDMEMTEARFIANQRGAYLRRQLELPMTYDLAIPKLMTEAIHRFYSETRSIDYIVLPQSGIPPIKPPADSVLKAYYDAHLAEYRAPEYRNIVVLALTLQSLSEQLAKTQPITDADVKKRYDEVKAARFTEPERRHVQQIGFPDQASAEAAAKKLAGGESFDALVAERKLTPKDVDLGTIDKASMFDKTIADAAFALPQGQVSQPVKGKFGWVLLRVAQIIPGQVIPYERVALAIRQELGLLRAHKEISKLHDKIEDQRNAGKTLAEAAQAVGLSARTIDAIDAQGNDKSGKPVGDIPDLQSVLKAVFSTDPGVETDPISTANDGTIWYEVKGVDAAHQRPLAEVKAKVLADWTAAERGKALSAKAVDLVKKLDGGETPAALAAETKLPLQHKDGVKRSGAPGLTQEETTQIFNRKLGGSGSGLEASGDRMVFKVVAATVPAVDPKDKEFQKTIDDVKTALSEDLMSQYLGQLQHELGVSINPKALRTAIGSE
jgi:peptidyl-prolyl cis-trans isomerase D